MTNYEKITKISIEELAKQRTKHSNCNYGFTINYVNDAGIFKSTDDNKDPFYEAVEAEIKWLNQDAK